MAVFYSFHYARDAARVQQVMNMGLVEGQALLNSQSWETVKARGDAAVEKWIDDQMKHKEAVVVLVGAQTSTRRWVRHEIVRAWNDKRPIVGIRIHGLAPLNLSADPRGASPFDGIKLENGKTIGDYVSLHDPAGSSSQEKYNDIAKNLKGWVSGAYRRS